MFRTYKIISTRQRRLYRILWALYLIVAILLLIARYSVHREYYLGKLIDGYSGHYQRQHPIEDLIIKKRAHFAALQARQSTTLAEATQEYQRRYGRSPPLGFDFWYELAREHDFVLIDEFDTLMRSMEPFHGVAPDVLQQRMQMTLDMAGDRVTPLIIQDGQATMENMLFFGKSQLPEAAWLERIPYNMTLLMNAFDEAMVSAPWDEVEQALQGSSDKQRCTLFTDLNVKPLIDSSGQDGWSATSQACPPDSSSRQFKCPASPHNKLPHFINNITASKDVCQNCGLLSQHGILLSPTSMRLAHDLVPVFSASKPSHFHDILIPSPYYAAVRNDYDAKLDIDWMLKKDQFYWAGSSTGGQATMKTWKRMQRHRLVLQTNVNDENKDRLFHVLEENDNGDWMTRISSLAESAKYFDTKVTNVVQCAEEACKAEKTAFKLYDGKPKDNRETAYSYKFVFDIDGNAFSGRFYRLLQSKSVVVKQTIFQEWHDDRLIPWVHYVPLSTGYEELPEIARFMAGSQKGLKLSERIATESTEWHDRALRDVDVKIVTLRMFLEYGRLMNPVC